MNGPRFDSLTLNMDGEYVNSAKILDFNWSKKENCDGSRVFHIDPYDVFGLPILSRRVDSRGNETFKFGLNAKILKVRYLDGIGADNIGNVFENIEKETGLRFCWDIEENSYLTFGSNKGGGRTDYSWMVDYGSKDNRDNSWNVLKTIETQDKYRTILYNNETNKGLKFDPVNRNNSFSKNRPGCYLYLKDIEMDAAKNKNLFLQNIGKNAFYDIKAQAEKAIRLEIDIYSRKTMRSLIGKTEKGDISLKTALNKGNAVALKVWEAVTRENIERGILKEMNFSGTDHFVARYMLAILREKNGDRREAWRSIKASWDDTGKSRSAYNKRRMFENICDQFTLGTFDNVVGVREIVDFKNRLRLVG